MIRIDPYFSIVSIVRNDQEGIERTARSVVAQTFKSYEWIVIDGASTDGTIDVIERYRDDVSTFVSERDGGIYDAMNKGLRRARGTYVIFLNGGDQFASSDVLNDVATELSLMPVDVLYGSSIENFGFMSVCRTARDPAYIWHGQPGLHQATFFKRIEHIRYEYDISYKICADYDVITRMFAARMKFRSIPKIISINDFNDMSASGRRRMTLLIEAARIQRKNLEHSSALVALSVMRRVVSSFIYKVLTSLDSARRSSVRFISQSMRGIG